MFTPVRSHWHYLDQRWSHTWKFDKKQTFLTIILFLQTCEIIFCTNIVAAFRGMCRLRNIAMRDYQESVTIRQTDTNWVHPLTMCNMSAKFDKQIQNGLVSIVFTSLFPYMSIVTLTFDLWPQKSIGFILSSWLTCLPSLTKKHATV